MSAYPEPMVPPGGIAPVPRRLRGQLGDNWLFDTERALYVWEFPPYPQYYIPLDDIDSSLLVDEETSEETAFGTAAHRGLRSGAITRPGAARILLDDAPDQLRQTVRFDWAALDAWFEEDEQVFVHPRNPYSRVDAVRSNRPIRVELDGVVLAEAPCSVMVFETGLPPRYYLDRTAIRLEHHERIRLRVLVSVQGTDQPVLVGAGGCGGSSRPGLVVRFSDQAATADCGFGGVLQRKGGHLAGWPEAGTPTNPFQLTIEYSVCGAKRGRVAKKHSLDPVGDGLAQDAALLGDQFRQLEGGHRPVGGGQRVHAVP